MASLQHLPALMLQRQLESFIKATTGVDPSRAAATCSYPAANCFKQPPESASPLFNGLLAPAPHAHKCSPLPSPTAAAHAANPFAMLVSLLQHQQQQASAAAELEASAQAGIGAPTMLMAAKEPPKWPFPVWSPPSAAAASGAVSPFVDHATPPHDTVAVGGSFSCPVCGCKVNHAALGDHFREELEMLESHFNSLKKLKDTKNAASNESLSMSKLAQGFDAACSTALSEKRYQAFLHVRSNRQRRCAAKAHRKRTHDAAQRDGANSSSPVNANTDAKFARLCDNAGTSSFKQNSSHAPQSATPGTSTSDSSEADKDACEDIDVGV